MYARKADFFDSQTGAPWATEAYGPEELAKLDRVFASAGPLEGKTVVEPGCGTGRLTEILARRVGPSGRVIAMDISRGMVASAKERLADQVHVELRQGRLEACPLPGEGVDLALCHQVFPHLEDQEGALSLLTRSLKPDGRLIICHFKPLSVINDVHRKAGTAVEQDMIPEHGEMEGMCTEAGLRIIELSDDKRGYFLCARKA
ncbi:class I SAM-dependent methyltransferase [Desulfoluna butyratoxydans]|uniref:S-adenosyl-l-methionine-dependent methyltransferase n=1 Tax=Desulfoluna butyratoxydans TaxID=231438 RepID=A0A4U8YXN6_9BACT|nr:methyltransferase domain-containing protein [Desulfoluna butyratoxydans]VFQ46832.1 s-adenosyl-l-methionine-dependent methyltransferase [Desulfoluna butyratoxydans]